MARNSVEQLSGGETNGAGYGGGAGCGGGGAGGGGYGGGYSSLDENAMFEPPDVFCALGSLIVEGRLPGEHPAPLHWKGGAGRGGGRGLVGEGGEGVGKGGGRGYQEGPHVELPGRISRHRCSSEQYLCAKNENFRRHMLLLWQNNVPMSIEVLLCSDCRVGRAKAGSLEVTTLPEPGSILLEQWTVSVLPHSALPGTDSLSLLQAVRSYLHFSQLSAWYSKTGGTSPRNILIRITIPGQEFATKFTRAPEEHYFPVASVGYKSSVAVSVRSLPRTDDIPLVVCSHTLVGDEEKKEEEKLTIAGSLSWRDPSDLRRSLVRAKLAATESAPGDIGCSGRLIKSDSMDSILGDSLLDPPQSLSKMAPRRYQSPSRCGSPSLEAPDHLLGGRRETKDMRGILPTYEQTMATRLGEDSPDFRLDRHDLMRRRDMNLFLGLHPKLLHAPPRLSLPPNTPRPSHSIPCRAVTPSTAIPCRGAPCLKPLPMSDRLPNHCNISGKHICEYDEVDEGARSLDVGSSCSPTGDNYKQSELGAKQKGWSSRLGRTSTPYSRDSSSDSSQAEQRLKPKTVLCAKKSDDSYISSSEMEDVLFNLKSRSSPSCSKDQGRSSLKDDFLEDILYPTKSRRSSIEDLVDPLEMKISPQITQVWRAEVCRSPSLDSSWSLRSAPHGEDLKEAEGLTEHVQNDVLLGALQEESQELACVPAIHSVRQTNTYSSSSSEVSPLTPDTSLVQDLGKSSNLEKPNLSPGPDYNVVDLCQELEKKCLISRHNGDKENIPNEKTNINGTNGLISMTGARLRSYSEASSPFKFINYGIQTLEPLDMSFEDFYDNLSFSAESVDTEPKSKSEKRRNSIEDDTIPSANKKAAFRKSFDSATSMVFHSRNGLPLTSSPAPMRRGIKFDFDSGISTPKDIKRALFESQSPEDSSFCGSPKKKKPDPRRLLSTSAPATVTGNNLLGNFEESVLNGRLEPVSTVEGFTAEIGASGTFHPRHLTFPVTVFFYTLCENSNIASPYLGHINLGKKGYRVPEKGTIQLTLFNPLGTVVKMFVVMYDLSDMPANSQTFLRQRTLYMPAGQSDTHEDARKWLRYLIHLRLTSSRSGKIYLHTDVRMIIFRKSDLDTASDHQQGKGFELRSFTRGPSNPKFSPRK